MSTTTPGDPADLRRLAESVWSNLVDLSEALDLADSYDHETVRAVNVVYDLVHHVRDDEIHRLYQARGVCRYCLTDPVGEAAG